MNKNGKIKANLLFAFKDISLTGNFIHNAKLIKGEESIICNKYLKSKNFEIWFK